MKANEFVKKYGWGAAKNILHGMDDASEFTSHMPGDAWDEPTLVDAVCLHRLVESHELVEKQGGLERVKKAIDGKHIGYTHFYLHSNGRYVFLDHYVDFIPDHAQHIGMFNKVIADVESCQ